MRSMPDVIAVPKENDHTSQYAREALGAPDNWQIHSWSVADDEVPEGHMRVRGCVAYVMKSGKRKGRPNWKKVVPDTEKTYFIKRTDFEAWQLEWEQRTGKCKECYGTGEEWAGWHHIEGNRYKTCTRCKGSKVPPLQEAVA